MAEVEQEEGGLDDFFAKKDKSKKKTKSKYTVEDIERAKKEAEGKKTALKKKKEKDSSRADKTSSSELKDDGEWNEYEQEIEKDYTGLRIQNLQIASKEEEERERQEEENENRENGESKDGAQGPWKGLSAPAPTQQRILEPARVAEPEKDAPKPTGKYVPPNLRKNAAGETAAQVRANAQMGPMHGARRKKTAPNVNSEEDFPTLANAGLEAAFDSTEFERFKGAARLAEDPSNRQVKLSLDNKFGALVDES